MTQAVKSAQKVILRYVLIVWKDIQRLLKDSVYHAVQHAKHVKIVNHLLACHVLELHFCEITFVKLVHPHQIA